MKIFGIQISLTKTPKPLPEWGVNLMSTVALNCQRIDDLEQSLDEVRRKGLATERKVYREGEKVPGEEGLGDNHRRQVPSGRVEVASLLPGATISPQQFIDISRGGG